MRNNLELGKTILQRRRTVIATADRVLITGLVSVFGDIGPLVGAATSESGRPHLPRQRPGRSAALHRHARQRFRGLTRGAAAKSAASSPGLPDADPTAAAQHDRGRHQGRL